MPRTKRSLVLAAAALLAGCSAPDQAVVAPEALSATLPVRGGEGVSPLFEACRNTDPARGLALPGAALYDVTAVLSDASGHTVARAWAPANRGPSRSVRLDRFPSRGSALCGGESLETEVVRAAGGDILRWRLDVGAPDADRGGVSVSSYRGEIPISDPARGGLWEGDVLFGGRRLALSVSAARGPAGLREDARGPATAARRGLGGSPLPDERSGRTLEEMRGDASRRAAGAARN